MVVSISFPHKRLGPPYFVGVFLFLASSTIVLLQLSQLIYVRDGFSLISVTQHVNHFRYNSSKNWQLRFKEVYVAVYYINNHTFI